MSLAAAQAVERCQFVSDELEGCFTMTCSSKTSVFVGLYIKLKHESPALARENAIQPITVCYSTDF